MFEFTTYLTTLVVGRITGHEESTTGSARAIFFDNGHEEASPVGVLQHRHARASEYDELKNFCHLSTYLDDN